jgi:hypothetical protein
MTAVAGSHERWSSAASGRRQIRLRAGYLAFLLLIGPALLGDAFAASAVRPASHSADRQLAAFDRTHPQCQLWTNWQKMCSRTGANGASVCVVDPDRPVAPSAPFCVAGDGSPLGPPTAAERASHRRFCSNATSEGAAAPLGLCEGNEERPFNGRRIAARQHPWCEMWADSTYEPVCRSGAIDAPGIPECRTRARRRPASSGKLICVKRAVPRWCEATAMLGEGPEYPFGGDYTGPGYAIGDATVVGVYCSKRR